MAQMYASEDGPVESESQAEKNERLLGAIEAYAENAYGSTNTSELSNSRSLSIERYLGKNIDPAPEGQSQIRDRTVYETIEWIKPSLLRIFAGSNEVVKFEPVGPEDEKLAEQESQYVNYAVTQKNNWHQICHDWFSDALLLKNGYAYVCWEELKVTESEFYENLTDEGMTMMANDPEIEIVAHSERPNEELAKLQDRAYQQQMAQYQQAMMQAQQAEQAQQAQQQMGQGEPAQMQQMQQQMPQEPQRPPTPMLHDIEVKLTNKKGQVKIHVLAPERCLIDLNTPDCSLEYCNYFEWFDFMSIGQARALGFKVPDDVSDDHGYDGLNSVSEENARDLYGENNTWHERDVAGYGDDPSMRMIRVRYIWIRHDFNRDGIDELQYCVVIGKQVFYRKECEEIPIGSISPIPLAHRHIGMSVADSVTDIEDINSAIIRSGVNNLFLANNPRTFVSERVNLADLLDSRPGGIIRVEGQPPQEAMPMIVPDIFPSAMNAVGFFDQRRQNRTGVNAYFQGTDSNTLNKTASGISQLTNSAAQRVEMIARLFAPGVMKVFQLAHKLILQNGHQIETIRMQGQWVQIDPSEWRKRNDIRLTVGLGTGNKEGLTAQLNNMFQAQVGAAQFPGVIKPENVYETLKEMARAASFTNPENYASDPRINPPQPQKPLEITLKEMDMQMDGAKVKSIEQGKQEQLQFQAWQQEQQKQLEVWKIEQDKQLKLALEQMKTGASVEIEGGKLQIESARLQNEVQPTLDAKEIVGEGVDEIKEMHIQTMQTMQQAIETIGQAISSLITISTAPKEVVRDKSGRVVGVKPVIQ